MTYKGLKIDYLEMGEGPLIVLFHGWGANKELFQTIMTVMSEKYRVVAPDVPGFGKSEEPKEPWNLDDYCDFAREFVKFALKDKEEPVILGGHSHGGRTLIKLLGNGTLPFQVTKLLLIDSAGIVHEKTPEQLRKMKRYKQGKKILNLKIVKTLFPNALEAFQKNSGSADYRMASPIMRSSMVKVINEDIKQYLPNIKIDTLLLWGDLDTDTPLADGKLMEQLMPNAGLAVLTGAGHFSFLDNQYQFIAILKSYLKI